MTAWRTAQGYGVCLELLIPECRLRCAQKGCTMSEDIRLSDFRSSRSLFDANCRFRNGCRVSRSRPDQPCDAGNFGFVRRFHITYDAMPFGLSRIETSTVGEST